LRLSEKKTCDELQSMDNEKDGVKAERMPGNLDLNPGQPKSLKVVQQFPVF